MQYVQIIYKLAEVAFNLFKVLGGNWMAIAALVMSMVELHSAFSPAPATAQTL